MLPNKAKTNRWLRKEESMRRRLLVRMTLLGILAGGSRLPLQTLSAAQIQTNTTIGSLGNDDTRNTSDDAQVPMTASMRDEIIDLMIKRKHDEIAAFDLYSPIIETYIQSVKFNQTLGTVPRSDYYFLGQADFRGDSKFTRWWATAGKAR